MILTNVSCYSKKYIYYFEQIHFGCWTNTFIIWTNTFCMLIKYILYFEQIHFVFGTNAFCIWNKYLLYLEQIPFATQTNNFSILNKHLLLGCIGYSISWQWSLPFALTHFIIYQQNYQRIVFTTSVIVTKKSKYVWQRHCKSMIIKKNYEGIDPTIIWWKLSQFDVVWTTLLCEQPDLSICFTLTTAMQYFLFFANSTIFFENIWLLYVHLSKVWRHYNVFRLLMESPNLGENFWIVFWCFRCGSKPWQLQQSKGKVSVRQTGC